MQFENPFAWILLLSTCISAGLIVFVWRRRKAPGARAILSLLAGVTIWTLAYGLQLFNTQVPALMFWTRVVYFGVVTVGVSWLIYALEYTGQTKLLTRKYLLLLLIEPMIVTVSIWTSDYHSLIYRDLELITRYGFVYLIAGARGPVFWLHTAFSYLALLGGTVILLRAVIRSPHLYQGQVGIVLAAASAPWVGNIIHLTIPLPVDPTPLTFMLTGLALSIGVHRYRLFNIIPVARDLVVESIDDAVVVLDDLARVVDANQTARTLFTQRACTLENEHAWIGQPCQVFFGARWEAIQPVLQKKRDAVNLGQNDTAHWFDLRVLDIHTRIKAPATGQLLVFHDIQERKQAEAMMAEARDQALQASLIKSQLIANVSHDLRTPMNAILGYSEMLVEGAFGALEPKQTNAVQQMFNAAQQMNLLINDLLDQALIEKGKLTLYPIEFTPAEMLAGVRSVLSGVALQKGLDLQFSVEHDLPGMLYGDLKRLQQILTNLTSNAVRYTDRGCVIVRLYRFDKTNWAMEVNDTGRGIPAEVQTQIFEPFAHFDSGGGKRQSGTGLGLAIVKHLVTMMDGQVTVESTVGHGSTFRVVLPLQQSVDFEKQLESEQQ